MAFSKSITDVFDFASKIHEAGGIALIVGGFVRDTLLEDEDRADADIDIEVYGLQWEQIKNILSQFGSVEEVGKQFGVMKIMQLGWDVSLPRTESKSGEGHRGFDVTTDPDLCYEDAARRRDLTINSVSLDPLSVDNGWAEYIDPLDGISDIEDKILRMSDPKTFGDDPLRALRVASFASRLPEFTVDPHTLRIVGAQPINSLPAERIFTELKKILLGKKPSRGFDVLRESGLLRHFPEINRLRDVPQEPDHHPEGCVYTHTMMVIDKAADLIRNMEGRLKDCVGDGSFEDQKLQIMFGALCHDFGKPDCTGNIDGKINTRGHEEAGVKPTSEFLSRLKAPLKLMRQVEEIVLDHLRPQLMPEVAKMKGYRRLMRRLERSNVSPEVLSFVSIADVTGRDTSRKKKGRSIYLNSIFLKEIKEYTNMPESGISMNDAVTGKHLIAIGMEPGIKMGEFLKACRHTQDEIGMAQSPGHIVCRTLKEMGIDV